MSLGVACNNLVSRALDGAPSRAYLLRKGIHSAGKTNQMWFLRFKSQHEKLMQPTAKQPRILQLGAAMFDLNHQAVWKP